MRVHHLNCGTLHPLGGRLVDGRPGLFRRATLVCHCLLLETGTGLALVETGMGSPAVADPAGWLGTRFARLINPATDAAETAVAQIRTLGFDPADVRDIAVTHLDLDHAGGLVDFPQARVHVYGAELAAFRTGNPRYRDVQFRHGPQWVSYPDAGDDWFGFSAVRELDGLPGVALVPLAGHTAGHAGVAVDTGNGWLLNAGDAYFFHEQMDAEPHCPPVLAMFERRMQTLPGPRRENQRRLRELHRDHPDEVSMFASHDPTGFTRLSERSKA
ncbi:MBL fold metallo-hydrolase [Amycolatopsis jiangsuensis]|uniref:Glyoxylase-like metal-dependent hydrolase (Beta-lactamase superfamily II) n=1 Tax=Amycolatopsis jiangsuensis TaxID=1181879 RepID=A0A840J2U7_9PSEU|nr:MBL fold metallo-hydrolase [Amycolatopsis jiangsuensis]MBB4688049.1 glyoxylase-like metal-dependent hydrolase (beta-lactamase superfamily II) [Amycolatopsis jiangsuensis]